MDILDYVDKNKFEQFPVACPICGNKDGHIFFYRYKSGSDKGSMWVWCSKCRHTAHAMFKLPEWWKNFKKVEVNRLTNLPDYLEENKKDIDEWINKLIINLE